MSLVDAPISVPITIANITLGLTITKVADYSPPSGQAVRRVRITNKHATQIVAYYITAVTATAPVFVASAGGAIAATEGAVVFPNSHEFIPISAACSLWLVASAGSTPVQVCEFDQARV